MSDRTDKDTNGALGTGCWRDLPRIVCWCVVVVVVLFFMPLLSMELIALCSIALPLHVKRSSAANVCQHRNKSPYAKTSDGREIIPFLIFDGSYSFNLNLARLDLCLWWVRGLARPAVVNLAGREDSDSR